MGKREKINLDNLIIVGDRLLIRPREESEQTKSGLFLPPGIEEREEIRSGYVIKVGPGYPLPIPMESHEPWKEAQEKIQYLPLQAKEGDLAIFLGKGAWEVTYQDVKYFIVPQNSVLMLERDEGLFE